MEQGDIILVKFPFSNLAHYKIRPALIVSNNKLNKKSDVWACAITSKKSTDCIPIKDSLLEGKLDKESFAKTNTIGTFEKNLIIKKIGKTNKKKTFQIIEKIIEKIKTA